jgi:hypothetical protein
MDLKLRKLNLLMGKEDSCEFNSINALESVEVTNKLLSGLTELIMLDEISFLLL